MKQEICDLGRGVKGESRTRRAGSILDITSDGYYKTDRCLADFTKVKIIDCDDIENQTNL